MEKGYESITPRARQRLDLVNLTPTGQAAVRKGLDEEGAFWDTGDALFGDQHEQPLVSVLVRTHFPHVHRISQARVSASTLLPLNTPSTAKS